MCDACVMGKVADRLGRRGMLAALAAAAAVAPASAAPVRTTGFSRVVDLTHTLRADFPTYFGTPAITVEKVADLARDGFNMNRLTYAEHVGTHFDAPAHFSAGPSIDAIAVAQLVCPLVVLDLRQQAANDPDYQVTPADLAAFERAQGRLPAGACLALRSGWDAHVATPRFRNAGPDGKMRFPGFRPDCAPLLLARGVAGVAVDTLSLDHGSAAAFDFHTAWLGAGRWGLEAVANLGALPAKGATLIGGAPKIAGGTGGPGRVLAVA